MTGAPAPGPGRTATVHATCLLFGETGILIRGPSGAGKSLLARALILRGQESGRFARLVADDRVALEACHGRLVARPVEPVAGLIEARGIGILRLPHEPAAVLGLVVDLGSPGPRLPDPEDLTAEILGIRLPRIVPDSRSQETDVLFLLRGGDDTRMTVR